MDERSARFVVAALLGTVSLVATCAYGEDQAAIKVVKAIKAPAGDHANKFYVSNRAPLEPSPLVKLPIGSITPRGWLRHQLEMEIDGMTGRLPEVSHWCKFEGNAWADPRGKGHSGWEEMPYWLKGYGDLGYVMHDERVIKEARKWIEAILASQREDGWFGPDMLLTSLGGKADLWPNMLALNVLQSYYEVTGDDRVAPFMARYFKWELNYPDKDLFESWGKPRGGDNLESIYWLYNRTGEAWLLDVASKVHAQTSDWTRGVANWHGVNFTQGFREPAIYWQQAKDEKFLHATEKDYQTCMSLYGQVPGGGFGADENARPGYGDPRQGFETCSIVEFMHSFEMLTRISGDPAWSDRAEELAFNTFPASQTPDLKGLHYLTSPNMIQLDPHNKSPGIQNGGTMFSFSPGEVYRCCQHNVSHGWPYYAEELWLATADNGLCASLYAASDVVAKVGDGTEVKISEETDYPFSDTIKFTISVARPVKFPLYLRLPRWVREIGVGVAPRGKTAAPDKMRVQPIPGYYVLDREWSDGDNMTFALPMPLSVRRWETNKDSVSVDRGPITYSLKIGETWKKYGAVAHNDAWPEYEVAAATPWNYGLVLDEADPAKSFEVEVKPGPLAAQPFTPDSAPIALHAKAKKIPNWQADEKGLIQTLQPSPVKSDEPVETVTLIPMGCARLRISQFPTIGSGAGAHEWAEAVKPPVSASHCFEQDTVGAMVNGQEPKSSDDHSIPRFTWWPHKGTEEWVQWDFKLPRKVSGVSVYWFDDAPRHGHCRLPASWEVMYADGTGWKPVKATAKYGVEANKFNKVTFEPVETKALRIEVKLQKDFSGGILQWRVE